MDVDDDACIAVDEEAAMDDLAATAVDEAM